MKTEEIFVDREKKKKEKSQNGKLTYTQRKDGKYKNEKLRGKEPKEKKIKCALKRRIALE